MNLPNYATNLAVIDPNNKVINIAWGYAYDTSWLPEDHKLVASEDLNIQIGDDYNPTDEHFYRNGEKIVSLYEDLNNTLNESAELIEMLYQDDLKEIG